MSAAPKGPMSAAPKGPMWGEYPYRVLSSEQVSPVIRELWLAPTADPIPFRAGQYVLLCDDDRRIPQRSYSVANAPRPDGRVSVLVTLVPDGPTSTWAHGLCVDDAVLLEGPYGTFVPRAGASGPVLLLAAGSGLAPARALAEALLAEALLAEALLAEGSRSVALVFSARSDADAIDRSRFESLAATDPRFSFRLVRTRDGAGGPLPRMPELLPGLVQELLPEPVPGPVPGIGSGPTPAPGPLRDAEVFVSGPPGFVAGCDAVARTLGATVIHTEEFFSDPTPWAGEMPALPVDSSVLYPSG